MHKSDGDDLIIELRVSPGASKDEMVHESGQLKIRITAPAVDGKANKHLVKYLGKLFKVPQSGVRIEKGEFARTKTVRIIEPRVIPEVIDRK